jgi:hypothetical protein
MVVDESGRTYIGGETNTELGNAKVQKINFIGKDIKSYSQREDLNQQRTYKYLEFPKKI